ncbi:MAG TPA: hypothetical protein VIP11_25745 [Gemmatimonadaceae bacterium]
MSKLSRRIWIYASVAAILAVLVTERAGAQADRGQPRAAFGPTDFRKLRWLEGTWQGTSPGQQNVYERYRFVNDTTIEITYFGDAALSRETGTGRVYLTIGRIYHTFGPGRWGATRIDGSGAYFVPQVNARNSFDWAKEDADSWTSTLRSSATGHETVTVYHMRRLRAP